MREVKLDMLCTAEAFWVSTAKHITLQRINFASSPFIYLLIGQTFCLFLFLFYYIEFQFLLILFIAYYINSIIYNS